jgi:hypothetical protein
LGTEEIEAYGQVTCSDLGAIIPGGTTASLLVIGVRSSPIIPVPVLVEIVAGDSSTEAFA